MAVARTTGDKGKCDALFSKIIRSSGKCSTCTYRCPLECDPPNGTHRKGCKLQTMHIVSRHLSNTRCDLNNALAGCAGCHHHYTNWPVDFGRLVLARIGDSGYDALVAKAKSKQKVNWATELARLQQIWSER